MNQETNDEGWQKIQSRIDLLARQFLKEDYPAIEYKACISGLCNYSRSIMKKV